MSRIQLNTLTPSELERHIYMNEGKLPAQWVSILMTSYTSIDDKTVPAQADPKQLNLFD